MKCLEEMGEEDGLHWEVFLKKIMNKIYEDYLYMNAFIEVWWDLYKF